MSLFKTMIEVKLNINADVNMAFATMAPYITDAEKLYIIPLIGQELFDLIDGEYNGNTLSPDNTALLPYIQKPLAYYAQLLSINELSVTFGDRGIRDNNTTQDSMPAPRWKQEKLELQLLTKGDRHADKLLKYLEANATSSKYALWFDDVTLNTRMSGTILYSTAKASEYIDINNSRRIYLRLRKFILDIEKTNIKKLVGKDQYDELLTQLKADTVSDANKILIGYLEPIIAKRALYRALPQMRVSLVDTGGIFLYSGTDEIFKQFAQSDDIEDYQEELKCGDSGFESDEQQYQEFLTDNIDDYPLIKASSAYTSRPDPGPLYTPVNDPTNGFFSV